jgi:NitT/TauT family transport system permease protein
MNFRQLLRANAGWPLIVALFAAWELAIRVLAVPNYLLPAPSEVAITAMTEPGTLLRHIAPTVGETVGGFVVGNVLGLLVAIVISQALTLQRTVLPILVGLRSVPIIAITPLLTLAIGRGAPVLITIVALICFFPIVVNATRGLAAVDAESLELMSVLHASRWQQLRMVRLPYALPYIFSALRVSATAAVLGAVVAEWLVADQGLGFFIEDSRSKWHIADMWAAITAATALAALGYTLMALIERRVRWWSEKENRT